MGLIVRSVSNWGWTVQMELQVCTPETYVYTPIARTCMLSTCDGLTAQASAKFPLPSRLSSSTHSSFAIREGRSGP